MMNCVREFSILREFHNSEKLRLIHAGLLWKISISDSIFSSTLFFFPCVCSTVVSPFAGLTNIKLKKNPTKYLQNVHVHIVTSSGVD